MTKGKQMDYVREILLRLLKKHYQREVKHAEMKNRRRIILKATELYRDYEKPNCDLHLKFQINEAAEQLSSLQYIAIEYLAQGTDIKKISLNSSKTADIEDFVQSHYGITARYYLLQKLRHLISKYEKQGELTSFYCNQLAHMMKNTAAELDISRESEILKMLLFIQQNQKDLYLREVSMFVYGSSKYFEKNRYESVCSIIREITSEARNEEALRRYHISSVEQEICIKGDCTIKFESYVLETKHFSGGISLSSKDVQRIKAIAVHGAKVITIENKTAFYRFSKEEYLSIYLGGYANRHQAEFLRKLYADNPKTRYDHFGDIDAGGFLIHQHLCRATGIAFQLFCMGLQELQSPKYRHCLTELSENDRERLLSLSKIPLYKEVSEAMLKEGVKLEQEIVCYDLMYPTCRPLPPK